MTKIKIYVVIILIALTGLYLGSIFTIKDQYDEKLYKLTKEKEKLIKRNHTLENDISSMGIEIESLNDIIEGNRQADCGWLQDFYDEFHEEVGANE